jgi:predicted deacetylase
VSKGPRYVEDGVALLSLHDVSPAFEDDVVATYDMLIELGISNFTLLVTPMYALKKSNSLENSPLFSEFLAALDLEISLHGYSHFTKSGSMDEFQKMDRNRVLPRMKSGKAMISDHIGRKPVGFVPPLWKAPQRVAGAAQDAGMRYCAIGNSIHRFSDSSVMNTADLLVSQGTKSTSFTNQLLEIELGGSVQVGVHPRDYRVNSVFDLLGDMKDRLDYQFVGYRSYLFRE